MSTRVGSGHPLAGCQHAAEDVREARERGRPEMVAALIEARDAAMSAASAAGWSIRQIADVTRLSKTRVHRIVQRRRSG